MKAYCLLLYFQIKKEYGAVWKIKFIIGVIETITAVTLF